MSLIGRNYSFQNPDPNSRLYRFKSLRYDPEMEELKQVLKAINKWETHKIQNLYRRAKKGTARGSQQAVIQLLKIIEDYKVEHMEADDPYMPHATAEQISNNRQGIHICDQAGDGIHMSPDADEFQLNTLVIGPPKAGKSSAIFYELSQMLFLPILILDIKNIWRHRAQALNAKVIQPPFHIDLEPPRGITWYDWIFSVLDGLALITGLQYGAVPFIEAAKIALQQREKYINHTQSNTSLSLRDIYHALDFVNTSRFKRDYILSCKTALQLIIGPNELFSAREGLPLNEIFTGRYIIECCYLSMIQCRFLAFYFLNYLLQASYHCLESSHLKGIIFIDISIQSLFMESFLLCLQLPRGISMSKYIVAQFKCQPWHSLTELSGSGEDFAPKSSSTSKNRPAKAEKSKVQPAADENLCSNNESGILANLSSDSKTLLYNIAFKLGLSVRERIKMLNFSCRTYENAKHELITKGLIIESVAGRKKYLITKPEAFEGFGLLCPYKNLKFAEHSFYMHITALNLKARLTINSVMLEYKIGTSGHTADIVTQSHDGILTAYELTLSASNIIQNCLKYNNTAFAKITFLCRNTDLMKAVKSTVYKAGLSLELLAKIDFLLLSSALKKEK